MSDNKAINASTTSVDHLEKASNFDHVAKQTAQGDEETERWIADTPIAIEAATNKRLFWKINRRVLVVMLVTCFFQSQDKDTLNFNSIKGIQRDANLHGQQGSRHLKLSLQRS